MSRLISRTNVQKNYIAEQDRMLEERERIENEKNKPKAAVKAPIKDLEITDELDYFIECNIKPEELKSYAESSVTSAEPEDMIARFFENKAEFCSPTEEQYTFLAKGIANGATLAQAEYWAKNKMYLPGINQKILQNNDKIKKALAEKNLNTMILARDSVATQVPQVVNNVTDVISRCKEEIDHLGKQIRQLAPKESLYGQLCRQQKEVHTTLQSYIKQYVDLLEWCEKGIRIASEDADDTLLEKKINEMMMGAMDEPEEIDVNDESEGEDEPN
jgi:hypothetical protein